MAPDLDPYFFTNPRNAEFSMFVLAAGGQNAAPYQTEAKSNNVGMALSMGPFFSQMLFNSE